MSVPNDNLLVALIDELAPVNNKFRATRDAVSKIELMWDFGGILSKYLKKNNLKLHELLYKIYDPYSMVKMSYITRDLGSYAYRIHQHFKSRSEIRDVLDGLISYGVFREAVPLLFNPKYKLSDTRKQEILKMLVSSSLSVSIVAYRLKTLKKQINPISNPRNQRAMEYQSEHDYLLRLHRDLNVFYGQNPTYPSAKPTEEKFGSKASREAFVAVLMALSSEAFLGGIDNINPSALDKERANLFEIVNSNSQKRARFRKWSVGTNELLKIAEALHSLNSESDYLSYESKLRGGAIGPYNNGQRQLG